MDFFSHFGPSAPIILLGLAIFPRITMLFIGGPFGVLQWLGWFFCPHFTVALFATVRYWDTDPLLVAISWIFALAGTGAETKTTAKTTKTIFRLVLR